MESAAVDECDVYSSCTYSIWSVLVLAFRSILLIDLIDRDVKVCCSN
jgi:hypothetical protein